MNNKGDSDPSETQLFSSLLGELPICLVWIGKSRPLFRSKGAVCLYRTDSFNILPAILILGQSIIEAKSVLSCFSMKSISRFAENVHLRVNSYKIK